MMVTIVMMMIARKLDDDGVGQSVILSNVSAQQEVIGRQLMCI